MGTDEREWTLHCRSQAGGVEVLEPDGSILGLGDREAVVPKSRAVAAEQRAQRLATALGLARSMILSREPMSVEAEHVIDGALEEEPNA